jgi:hypothetical protein
MGHSYEKEFVMPRLSRGVVEEREQFMIKMFEQDPNMSVGQANDRMKEQFGSKVRSSRAYELRKIAQESAPKAELENGEEPKKRQGRPPLPKNVHKAVPKASPPPRKMPAVAARNAAPVVEEEVEEETPQDDVVMMLIRGNRSQLEWFQSTLNTLKKGKMDHNLVVDQVTDTYAVVRSE